MKVELSAEAQAQVDEIDAWWRDNRRAAPNLFAEELEAALRALAETPPLGVRYASRPDVRRLLLRRTHYHLYVTEEAARVYVVAVWSTAAAARGCSAAVERPRLAWRTGLEANHPTLPPGSHHPPLRPRARPHRTNHAPFLMLGERLRGESLERCEARESASSRPKQQ